MTIGMEVGKIMIMKTCMENLQKKGGREQRVQKSDQSKILGHETEGGNNTVVPAKNL